jgi:hypothetical protein
LAPDTPTPGIHPVAEQAPNDVLGVSARGAGALAPF